MSKLIIVLVFALWTKVGFSQEFKACPAFLESSISNAEALPLATHQLLEQFNQSEITHLFVQNKRISENQKNLEVGVSYTVMAHMSTGELVVGYKTKVPLFMKALKGFSRMNAGTHLTLNKLFTRGSIFGYMAEDFLAGAFKIRHDGSVDVAGFNNGGNDFLAAKFISLAIKQLSPGIIIHGTSGRLPDSPLAYLTSGIQFELGPYETEVRLPTWTESHGKLN